MTDFSDAPTQCMSYRRVELRREFTNFLLKRLHDQHSSKAWASVTLTLKPHLIRQDGTWQPLTRGDVEKCIKRLLKALNRKIYGAAYRRYSKKLAVIPSIEGGSTDKLHVHLTLQIPDRMLNRKTEFFDLIVKEWSRIRWAHREHDIKWLRTIDDLNRWTAYITKEMYRRDDVIDLDSLSL